VGTRRRHRESASPAGIERTPSSRRLARLILSEQTQLAKAEAVLVATIESALPSFGRAKLDLLRARLVTAS
jgi:hypothetical protein